MSDTKRVKIASALSVTDRETADEARRLFEEKAALESAAAESKERAQALADGLLKLLRSDEIEFADGYKLYKSEESRVSYAAKKLTETMLAMGMQAKVIQKILEKAGTVTPVVKIAGRAPKGQTTD